LHGHCDGLQAHAKKGRFGAMNAPPPQAATIETTDHLEKYMYFLGLGIILLAMKYLEIAPVAAWSWLIVFAPFGLAVAWWSWADASGYTKRKAMEQENKRKQERIDKNKDAIGTLSSRNKRR
jgi:small Trp-rich protein